MSASTGAGVDRSATYAADVAHGSDRPMATRVLGWAIVVLSALQLMVVLDGTVVNLALARLQEDMDLSDSGRTWVITSYALAFGGLMLLGGRLGDSYGRKKMFVYGVAAFTVASFLAGCATNEALLLGARVLQGAGAAVASPTAFALVATTFAAGPVRNQAFAVFAMMTGIGSVSGLLLGGVLTEVSWRWIFLVNLPVGAVILLLAPRALPESQGPRRSLDVRGAVLATLACTALVFGVTQGPEQGWASTPVVAALAGGIVLLVWFLLVERTAPNPLLPFVLFRERDRVAAFIAILLGGAVTMCMAVYIALFVQDVLKYSPLEAGMSFVPFAFALGISAQVATKLALRVQPRWLVAFGAVLMAGGFLGASTLDQDATYLPDLLVPILVGGAGIGFSIVPLTVCAVAGVKATEIGPLTAIALVAQTLGGALGLAVISAVATSRTLSEGGIVGKAAEMTERQLVALGDGYTTEIGACALIAALIAVVVLGWMRFTPAQVAEAQHSGHLN
jgi:EmrB/QacA subfamily drug resistance transporter